MKIAYVTTYDATNVQAWSGLVYNIAQSLQNQSLSIEYIDSLKDSLGFKIILKLKQILFNKKYMKDREPFVLDNYARQISERLSKIDSDVVFSPGTIPIAHLQCQQPIVFWTDATFAGMIDFYPEFSNLSHETIKKGNLMEKTALENCKLAIYSSDWAAKTAIDNYKINPSKVKVVPFGANIICNRNLDDIKTIVNSRPVDKCKLLFIGTNWLRKGGNIALEATKKLQQAGVNVELTVVGYQPDIEDSIPSYVKFLGFISKSSEEGKKQLDKLIAESHFLILPTQADCTPIVFGEANSFGVPCISTNVGGIPTIIKEGFNGQLFSKDADIAEYCQYISDIWSNYSQYKNLAISSFHEYDTRLNWSVAGKTIKQLLTTVC